MFIRVCVYVCFVCWAYNMIYPRGGYSDLVDVRCFVYSPLVFIPLLISSIRFTGTVVPLPRTLSSSFWIEGFLKAPAKLAHNPHTHTHSHPFTVHTFHAIKEISRFFAAIPKSVHNSRHARPPVLRCAQGKLFRCRSPLSLTEHAHNTIHSHASACYTYKQARVVVALFTLFSGVACVFMY